MFGVVLPAMACATVVGVSRFVVQSLGAAELRCMEKCCMAKLDLP